ncbi:CPBP family intramembrane metalloprotease domain-containing protein, partial [Bacillus halotolerans]
LLIVGTLLLIPVAITRRNAIQWFKNKKDTQDV